MSKQWRELQTHRESKKERNSGFEYILCCHCTCQTSHISESSVFQVCQMAAIIVLPFSFHLYDHIPVWVVAVIFRCSVNICHPSKGATHYCQGNKFLHRKKDEVEVKKALVWNILKLKRSKFEIPGMLSVIGLFKYAHPTSNCMQLKYAGIKGAAWWCGG